MNRAAITHIVDDYDERELSNSDGLFGLVRLLRTKKRLSCIPRRWGCGRSNAADQQMSSVSKW